MRPIGLRHTRLYRKTSRLRRATPDSTDREAARTGCSGPVPDFTLTELYKTFRIRGRRPCRRVESRNSTKAFCIILTGAAIASCAFSHDENRLTADYAVTADVPYCTGEGKPLLMDVFLPYKRLRQPTPAVLWLHGGGWERGDKNGSSGVRFLAEAGFVTASIYYRLSGEAKFPVDIEDCKCAIRYLRANGAKYGLDPDRIGIAGASSGGHLALLVAMADEKAGLEGSGGWPDVSSRVSAVSSYYGPADFTALRTEYGARAQAAITKLMGAQPEEAQAAYKRASPIKYLGPGKPPVLMIHGDGDTLVPFSQSQKMLEASLKAGVTAQLIQVKNANHDFEPVNNDKPLSTSVEEIHTITVDFFKRNLR